MRSLTSSLIIVVLMATVGLGWLMDQFYNDYTNSDDSKALDAVTTLEQIGADLALTLNNLSMIDYHTGQFELGSFLSNESSLYLPVNGNLQLFFIWNSPADYDSMN